MADIDPQKLAERLAKLNEPFAAASTEERNGFGDDVEDGTYQAVTQRWGYFESEKKNGAAYLKLAFEIALDPKYEGSVVEKVWGLEPHVENPDLSPDEVADRLGFLKRDLKRFGVDVDAEDFSYAELIPGSALLESLLDLPVEIVLKTKGQYQNVYLNAVTGGKIPGGAKAMSPRSDIPTDLEPQTIPGVPVAQPQSAIAGDDDIPF